MTMPEMLDLIEALKEQGVPATVTDEVGLMRAKNFYRSLGWVEKRDFYVYGGQIYFDLIKQNAANIGDSQ